MEAAENKLLMEEIFAGLAKGDGKPFRDSLADDFRWTLMGTTRWSGTYEGKRAVIDRLLRPLFAQFADQYTNTAHRFIAEDDYVVIECRGRVTTKSGRPLQQQLLLGVPHRRRQAQGNHRIHGHRAGRDRIGRAGDTESLGAG